MERIKNIIGRVKELRMHNLYIGEEAANGMFRAKAFSEAQDYGDILEALKGIIEKDTEIDPYKIQRAVSLLHHIVPEKEKALRVCDESYKPVLESELWVFRQALDILGRAPINKFFSREERR